MRASREGIHAASLESPRLQEMRRLLQSAGVRGATTAQILAACPHIKAVSAAAAELRKNGVAVVCRFEDRSESGGSIYRYWLEEFAPREPGETQSDALFE